MNAFKTQSSPRKLMLTIVYTYIPMFLLAFLGLKIGVVTWLYFECIFLCVFLLCLFLVYKTRWEINFLGNNVNLVNTGNRQSYYIKNLTQAELIIKQSPNQKRKDCCDLEIANAPFKMYDVKQCRELMTYIKESIPENPLPKNSASDSMAFTCCHVLEQHKPILYVAHDEDGDWQFLCGENHSTKDGRIIGFQEALDLDPSIRPVCNLRRGQTAVRDTEKSEWKLL